MVKKVQQIILLRLFSILFFLIMMVVANALIPSIQNNMYERIVNFFNSNLLFIILLMFITILNEVFWSFYFPFNFIAPITTGALGVYITMFIYKIWSFLDAYLLTGIVIPIATIYLIVFLVSLVFGYLFILDRGGRPKEDWGELWNWQKNVWKKSEGKISKFEKKRTSKDEIEWKDVGSQFKLFFYNIGRSMNKSFENKPRQRKR
jgi:hypothetical protein